jgi:hypothetical protein
MDGRSKLTSLGKEDKTCVSLTEKKQRNKVKRGHEVFFCREDLQLNYFQGQLHRLITKRKNSR